jgi:hypothetical protein
LCANEAAGDSCFAQHILVDILIFVLKGRNYLQAAAAAAAAAAASA